MNPSPRRHIEPIVAISAAVLACALAAYAAFALPDKAIVTGVCALSTCYGAARTIWPMSVRQRHLEPKEPVKRAAHADAVAAFAIFACVSLAITFALALYLLATRSVQRPLLPLAISPAAMALAAIAFAMQWRVYARAIRATIATPS